jgi:hypothetical protein
MLIQGATVGQYQIVSSLGAGAERRADFIDADATA